VKCAITGTSLCSTTSRKLESVVSTKVTRTG
jgi:hypothetical protein